MIRLLRKLLRPVLALGFILNPPSGFFLGLGMGVLNRATEGAPAGGAALPTWHAAGTAVSGVGDASPAWPVGHAEFDIGLLIVASNSGQAAALSVDAGFVQIPDSPQDSASTNGSRLTVFANRASSGAMGAPTITDPGNHVHALIVTIRGCITTGNAWQDTAGDAIGADDTAISIPGGDTTGWANCLVVAITSHGADGQTTPQISLWANADLANVTERVDAWTNQGSGSGLGVATGEKATAGAFGATTATCAVTGGQGHLMIALKGAP